MKICIFGAGVQGTVFGARLAHRSHDVSLVARSGRAAELRQRGASIQNFLSTANLTISLPIIETLPPDYVADLCLVTVRREQLQSVLPCLAEATNIGRFVFLVNHANGSEDLIRALGKERVILAFPGIAGSLDDGMVSYVEISQQPTVVESDAADIIAIFRDIGLRVRPVIEMDAWLRRHAVFITAIAGVLYENGCDPQRLAKNSEAISRFIRGVRQGWLQLDRMRIEPAPLALRTIICWVPLRMSVRYWRRLLESPSGELYFAGHARHALLEMAALAADVRGFVGPVGAPELNQLLGAIDRRAGSSGTQEQS